tara:strand:+ start:1 stop:2793 length:2793 start_codon:yes stop_codon:yes gene_type:complete
MGLGKTYSTDYLVDSNGNTGVAGQILVTTSTGVNWQDAENTGDNQTQGSLFDSKIVLIDTPNGGLKPYRVITDEYGEWIQVGRFAANASSQIKTTWSSVSGLSTGIAQSETTQFSADFGDSFPTEVRVVGATDFNNWRNTRTIDWVYKVPEGRKWKYFFSNGAENGMTPKVPQVGGSTRFGWTVNGAYDGFGRWSNPDLVNIGMSDSDVTNPSAAYTTATSNAFNWNSGADAKLTVNAFTTYSGQDAGTTSQVGVDDNNLGFYDTWPTQTNNGTGGTEFSSAVWVLIKLPGGASGSGGGYWAANGNNIYNTNSDYVGIGTDSPDVKLWINDTGDGDKIRWGKDNALVGSIGTYNGVPYIGYQGGAGGGIMFNGASIEPTLLGNSRSSNTNDIGSTTYRWKDGWFAGQVTAGEYNLPSGGMLDWANGDARIVEGLVNNYSLSFQTYDGANATTALRLEGNNNAFFAGTISSGVLSVGASGTSRFTDTSALPLQLNRGLAVDVYGTNGVALGLGSYTTGTTYVDAARIAANLEYDGTTASGDLFLQVNNSGTYTNALTINNDTNATFAGKAYGVTPQTADSTSMLATKGYVNQQISGGANYLGTWDPDNSLNSGYGNPSLEASGRTDTSGDYFICSADGGAHPNGGACEPDTWHVGDWVVWNSEIADCAGTGTGTWQKVDNTSVLSGIGTGQTVALWEGLNTVLDSETLGNAPITVSGTATTFAGNITVNGSISGNTNNTTEVGTYTTGAIKRIRMVQGGELHFGDTTTAAPLGITEGDWNQFADQDRLSIYGRSSIRLYSGAISSVLRLILATDSAFVGNVKIDSALLSNQENTDVGSAAAEMVAQVATSTYTAAFFDFVIKKGLNVRSGTVYACHDGDTTPLVAFTETSTNDLGDTSDVTLSVDISGSNMRLLATVTSDNWIVKSLIRAI